MRVALLCSALLALAQLRLGACQEMSWAPCDTGLTAFVPSSVVLTPDPPVIGSPATFVISGSIESELQGGVVEMTVSFSGLPIYSSSSDLCGKTACPVPAGPIDITLVQALPPIAPPGDYGLQVIARAPDGSELACVNVDFTLVLPSASASASAVLAGKSQAKGSAAAAGSGAAVSGGSAGAGATTRAGGGGGGSTAAVVQHRKERLGATARSRRAVL